MANRSRKLTSGLSSKKASPKKRSRAVSSSTTSQVEKKKNDKSKTKGASKIQTNGATGNTKRKEKSSSKTQASKRIEASLRKEPSTTRSQSSKNVNNKPKKKLNSEDKVSGNKSNLGRNKNDKALVETAKVKKTKSDGKEKQGSKVKTNIQQSTTKRSASTKGVSNRPKITQKAKARKKPDLKACTVKAAFQKFQSQIVDLERVATDKGRASRDYLFDQIKKLAKNQLEFPPLSGDYISFGSFARKTKIRPLNDIDLLVVLKNGGLDVEISYQQKASGYGVKLTAVCKVRIIDSNSPLKIFANNNDYVNSIKILNRIKHCLAYINNYKKSGKNRRMQAVTLNLKSQPWTFDIVPAIPIYDYRDKVTHFLIPDGYGNWIRTNPKIDAESITSANIKQKGRLLPILRLLKYWNGRRHKPILMSYYFETLVVQTFQYAPEITNIPAALEYFFQNCNFYLMSSCPDPKRLGEALDVDVDSNTKQSISNALRNAASHARHAIAAESKNDQKTAIYWWKKVFGSEFPIYG